MPQFEDLSLVDLIGGDICREFIADLKMSLHKNMAQLVRARDFLSSNPNAATGVSAGALNRILIRLVDVEIALVSSLDFTQPKEMGIVTEVQAAEWEVEKSARLDELIQIKQRLKDWEPEAEKKTSSQWMELLHPDMIVCDPDGWDRSNFTESWNEKITKTEFERRFDMSTVGPKERWSR